jgi:hypothetical protein
MGVASGSNFTQLIDSIVNWIVTQYCFRKAGHRIRDMIVLGDDCLIALDSKVSVEELSAIAREVFGMTFNVVKTQQDVRLYRLSFLGYRLESLPVKDEKSLWASLVYPEAYDVSYDRFATRAMGLLIANFGVHVEFDRTCRLIVSKGFDPSETRSLSRYLDTMGIEVLPRKPPDIFTLYTMAVVC